MDAQNPVIIADRLGRTPAGMENLIDLAEALQAPVISRPGRMNFPSRHPLNQTDRANALIREADVVLGLEMSDFRGNVNSLRDQMRRTSETLIKPGAKLISIIPTISIQIQLSGFRPLPRSGSGYRRRWRNHAARADRGRQAPVHRRQAPRLRSRGAQLAKAHQQILAARSRSCRRGLGCQPDQHRAICAELWNQIKDRDWSLVSTTPFISNWPSGCGIWISTITTSARKAATVSAMARPQLLARRSPTQIRPPHGEYPVRRRSDVCPRRPLDRRASSDSAAQRDAQ